MKNSPKLFLILLTLTAFTVGEEEGGKSQGQVGGKPCRGTMMNAKAHESAVIACNRKLKAFTKISVSANADNNEKICALVEYLHCLADHSKIIHDGKLNKEGFEKYFQDYYPGEVGIEMGKTIYEKCATEENLKFLGHADKCIAMVKLVICQGQQQKVFCG